MIFLALHSCPYPQTGKAVACHSQNLAEVEALLGNETYMFSVPLFTCLRRSISIQPVTAKVKSFSTKGSTTSVSFCSFSITQKWNLRPLLERDLKIPPQSTLLPTGL